MFWVNCRASATASEHREPLAGEAKGRLISGDVIRCEPDRDALNVGLVLRHSLNSDRLSSGTPFIWFINMIPIRRLFSVN